MKHPPTDPVALKRPDFSPPSTLRSRPQSTSPSPVPKPPLWFRPSSRVVTWLIIIAGSASPGVGAKPMSPTPKSNPSTWTTDDDYPLAALAAREQGKAGFRLSVDASGAVTACTIIASSGSQLLDDATCTLMRGTARLSPALDKKGRPTSGTYSSSITWKLPEPSTSSAPH
jgi:protein TonB